MLADQAIGVLIGSPFPGSIRMGKIYVCFQDLGNFFMSREFLAVITGDGMNRIIFQQVNDALFDCFFGPLFHQPHPQESAFSIDQGHNRTFHPFANDGVSFPVANPFSSLYECWALLYAPLVGYFATIVAVCTSFSILFLSPKMFVQLAAILFVFPDMLIDPFGTDLEAISLQDPVSGLFGTEILSQVSLNDQPALRCDPSSGFSLSPLCLSLGLFIAITSSSCIPFQFSADRRFMNADDLSNFSLLFSYFQKLINKVSLFIGKLRVTHREAYLRLSAPSTLVSGKSIILLQLTFLLPTLLHLRVESKLFNTQAALSVTHLLGCFFSPKSTQVLPK